MSTVLLRNGRAVPAAGVAVRGRWVMSMVNRDCALLALEKVVALADGTKGGRISPEAGATAAVAYALLDVADAIREQTAALDLGSIRADLDDISAAAGRRAS